jgi:hypothetical protein
MKWLFEKLRRWLLADEIQKCREAAAGCRAAEQMAHVRLEQLNALAAVDLPFARDAGFIVVVTNVHGQPRVHLTYIRPDLTMKEWRDWQVKLEHDFGASLQFIDAPKYMAQMAHHLLRS